MERLEVAKATIKRELVLLRDQPGAPWYYDREQNGYLYDRQAG